MKEYNFRVLNLIEIFGHIDLKRREGLKNYLGFALKIGTIK